MKKSPLRMLLSGDYGLPRTFWLFGVLSFAIIGSLLYLSMAWNLWLTTGALKLFGTLYEVCVWIGVWRAAQQYKGSSLWTFLARALVIFVVIVNIVQLGFLLSPLFQGYFSPTSITLTSSISIFGLFFDQIVV